MTTTTLRQQILIFLGLAALMLATRFHHFATALHMPDASLAIFFVAGFYLRRVAFFALLGAAAVSIDYVAVNYAGISTWCITPAYGALALSYLVAWAGGYWSSRNAGLNTAFALRLAFTALAATSAGFLIADGSFYWLSGRIAEPNGAGYWSHMTLYFASFVGAACAYIAAAALLHGALLVAGRRHHSAV
jgi:hypothetical protein